MAIFRLANGTYYIISSHLTGWNPNPLMLFRAQGRTLDDPQWVYMGNPTNECVGAGGIERGWCCRKSTEDNGTMRSMIR